MTLPEFKVFKQETPYYCGPACLQVVATRLGRWPTTQDALAGVAGTTSGGTGVAGLKRALKAMGFQFVIHRGAHSIPDGLNLGVVWEKKRNHWLVAELSLGGWWVYDPEFGNVLFRPGREFEEQYFSRSWSYGLFGRVP